MEDLKNINTEKTEDTSQILIKRHLSQSEIDELVPFDKIFPLRVGEYNFPGINSVCDCGCHLGGNDIKGKVTAWNECVAIKGLAVCPSCKSERYVGLRLRSDGTVLAVKQNGDWEDVKNIEPATWWERLKSAFCG